MQRHDDQQIIDALVQFAERAGATKARCLPHVSGPAGIRKLLQSCKNTLVFRIETESASLHGADRPAVMRLLHEITAEIETEAKRLGFSASIGFAGGSCKESFCPEQPHCRVLAGQGECRHPHHARTSMSGYGVNVGELMKSAGWSNRLFSSDDEGEQLAWVAGLVLLC